MLQSTGLSVEVGSGGRTKFNRKTRSIEKHHWTDAACVGASTPEKLLINGVKPLIVKAKGHGRRQRCGTDRYGFPIRHAPAQKFFMGFQTGDLVKADVKTGKYAGIYTGRIAIRFKPSFKLTTGGFAVSAQRSTERSRRSPNGKSFDVHPKYLKAIHQADGYEYTA